MKRSLMISSLAATLIAASSIASAQTPAADPTQETAAPAQKSYTDPNDPSKGQELVSDKKAPVINPATVGQDKATGNNLVPEKTDGQSVRTAATERPAFETLDVNKLGYLTPADVSTHVWLSKNFARCNTGHDGHLTSQEYALCLQ